MRALPIILAVPATAFALALQSPSAHATDAEYASLLGYLTDSRIDGQAMRGSSGVTGVNMAAGDFNQQANLRVLAAGGSVVVHARQQQLHNLQDAPDAARASIAGTAYADARGVASINQASGNGNAQVNVLAVALTMQGIRETTDGALSAAVSASAGERQSEATAASGGGSRSVAVESSAMHGFQGLLQLNQAAGSGNLTGNQLLLAVPPTPR